MYKRLILNITAFLLIIFGSLISTKLLNCIENLYFYIFFSISLYLFFIFIKNKIVTGLVSTIILLCLFMQMIIIPYSFYMVWLEHIKESIPQGKISNLINYVTIFVWVFFISDAIKNGTKTNIIKIITIFSLLLSIFISKIYIYIVFIVSLLFVIVFNIIKNKSYDKVLPIISTLIIISIISINTGKKETIKHSVIVENMSYNIRKIIVNYFPNVDLLTTIPGMSDQFRNNNGKPPILTNSSLLKIKGNPGELYHLRMSVGYVNSEHRLITKQNTSINTTRKLKLTVLSDFLPIMPTTLDTVTTSIYDLPDSTDFTFKIDNPLPRNSEFYIIWSENSKYNLDIIDDTIFEISNRLEKLAASLKGDTEEKTANNIRNFLLNNYSYSLETKPNDNYISHFLFESKEGFCVHFTRAFILLARLNNLKCREISGYAVIIPRRPEKNNLDYGEEIITGKNSHLWPEIYINDEWRTFEVTPAYYQDTTKINQRVILPISNNEVTVSEKKQDINYLLLLIPLSIIIILIIVNYFRVDVVDKLVRLSNKKKIPHPKEIGWIEWNRLFLKNENYINIIIEMNYSKRNISHSDKNELMNIYKKLRK